jgi:hypothetical protein
LQEKPEGQPVREISSEKLMNTVKEEEEEMVVTGPLYWYYLAIKILLWLVLQVPPK